MFRNLLVLMAVILLFVVSAFACESSAVIGRWYSDKEFKTLAFELQSNGNLVFPDTYIAASGISEAAFRINMNEHKLQFRLVHTDGRVSVETHLFKVDGKMMNITRESDKPSVLNTKILYRK